MSVVDDITDPKWIAYARACIGRLEAIRDAFLEGRDAEAVQILREVDPTEGRCVLPVSSLEPVRSGQTVQAFVRPQIPFKPDRFCVAEEVAGSFLIHDVKVGTRSMFPASGDLAGLIASSRIKLDRLEPEVDEHGFWTIKIDRRLEELIGVEIEMPVCLVSQDLSVIVTNESSSDRIFRGAFFGNLMRGAS